MAARVVLVVDDDVAVRGLYVRALARAGFHAIPATDGVDALARLDDVTELDVVLLDWRMPKMDGPAFVRALRRHARFADTPVVVISGNADVLEAASAIGVECAVAKPARVPEIVDAIRRVLRE